MIRKVGQAAQEQLLKRNPNIQIDVTDILPVIPNATRGPHEYVVDADELPVSFLILCPNSRKSSWRFLNKIERLKSEC